MDYYCPAILWGLEDVSSSYESVYQISPLPKPVRSNLASKMEPLLKNSLNTLSGYDQSELLAKL